MVKSTKWHVVNANNIVWKIKLTYVSIYIKKKKGKKLCEKKRIADRGIKKVKERKRKKRTNFFRNTVEPRNF